MTAASSNAAASGANVIYLTPPFIPTSASTTVHLDADDNDNDNDTRNDGVARPVADTARAPSCPSLSFSVSTTTTTTTTNTVPVHNKLAPSHSCSFSQSRSATIANPVHSAVLLFPPPPAPSHSRALSASQSYYSPSPSPSPSNSSTSSSSFTITLPLVQQPQPQLQSQKLPDAMSAPPPLSSSFNPRGAGSRRRWGRPGDAGADGIGVGVGVGVLGDSGDMTKHSNVDDDNNNNSNNGTRRHNNVGSSGAWGTTGVARGGTTTTTTASSCMRRIKVLARSALDVDVDMDADLPHHSDARYDYANTTRGSDSKRRRPGSSVPPLVAQLWATARRVCKGPLGLVLAITTHLLTATVFLALFEGWPVLDALYFAVVIATTVGYGDITPSRAVSKMFVAVYAIVSVAMIANMLQRLVERIVAAQREMAGSARRLILGSVAGTDTGTSTSTTTTTTTTATLASSSSSSIVLDGPVADENDDMTTSTTMTNTHHHHPDHTTGLSSSLSSPDVMGEYKCAVDQTRLKLYATLCVFFVTCVSGVLLYKHFLNESLVDVIYFLCISMTTVGLGDIHPKSRVGKGFATVWLILTSLGFANLLAQVADVRVKQREYDMAKRLLSDSLSLRMFDEMDADKDESLSQGEYLGYVLCKMGKATPEDVRAILTRFRQLDIDGSGFITKKEIDLAMKKQL